jgi:hypothetical protein
MQRIVVSLVVAAVFSIVPVAPLFAQGALSEINGTATDQSGAVLPGVTVTLTEETTGLVRTVITNDAGRWVLPALQPGRYTIKAELSGFQTQNRGGVVVNVGQAITINLALPVGTLTDQVTVSAEAPLVEVTRSDVGTNITGQNIDALPTAGRQQYALLQLVPGLTPTLAAGSFEGAQYSAGGQSTSNNVFMVDGAYNNDDRTQSGPGMQTRMTIDTTSEYQVLVHDFGAEYGGAAGAVINAVTRGGSNEFHGRAAYYLQDSKLDATNYFLKLAGAEPAKSGVKTMLANIGGPIIKNKAFFFANVERLRIRQAADLLYPANAAPLAVSYSTFPGRLGELFRPPGLSDQPVEQRERPRRFRCQSRERPGPCGPAAHHPGDEDRACAKPRRNVHQRAVAQGDGQPAGQRVPSTPCERKSSGRRPEDVRQRWFEHDLQGQRVHGTREDRSVRLRRRADAP